TLQCLQIPQGKGAILQQIRDEKTRRAAKKVQQVAYQSASVLALIQGRLKKLSIANLLHLSQRALFLKSIDERLHGCVSNAFIFGEAFQPLAHRRGAEFPELLQDAGFGFGKTRLFHDLLPSPEILLQATARLFLIIELRPSSSFIADVVSVVPEF